MDALVLNVRVALRRLSRSPLFTVIAIATLAAGIGATTAVFSVVDGVLFHPLPYPQPDRLVWINFTAPGLGYEEMPFSDGAYLYVRNAQHTLQKMALFSEQDFNLSADGTPRRVSGVRVTPDFFGVFGVDPILGRAFTPTDGQPGSEPVVVLSHALWITEFKGDRAVLGRMLTLDGVRRRVIGVAPATFAFPDATDDLWIPLVIDPAKLDAGNFSYPCVGRLEPGATLVSARGDLQTLVAHIGEAVPDLTPAVVAKARLTPMVRTLAERTLGELQRVFWIVLGTSAFVLLIACANVANLFLVRADGRSRELAVRTALGANRVNLFAALLSESLLLSMAGGALGLLLATFGVSGILRLLPATFPGVANVAVNGDVLLFTLGASALTGLVFGSLPLLGRQNTDLSTTLKESGRVVSPGTAHGRARNVLVTVQVALALVLLVGAGLMVRTFEAVRRIDPGFHSDSILTFDLTLPSIDYPTASSAADFWRAAVERIATLPGVRSAAATNNLPLGSHIENGSIMIEDHPTPAGALMPVAERQYVSQAYFGTLRIPLLQGRLLTSRDGADGVHAVVVNRSFARHWWPNGSALGHSIRESPEDPWYEIVGVVGDIRFQSLEKTGSDAVYFPVLAGAAAQPRAPRHMAFAVRTILDPLALAPSVRAQMQMLDAHLPVANVQTLRSVVAASTTRTSFTLLMLGIAGGVSLLLGVIGIYGVISYTVGQRRHEIAVRMALGAAASDVRGMVVRQGLVLAGWGVIVGSVVAMMLSRFLQSLLFGVSTDDPLTYGGVIATLLAVSTLATYLPARRAAATDPAEVLRLD